MYKLSRVCLKLCCSLLFSLMVPGIFFSYASIGTDIFPVNNSADSLARYLTGQSGIRGGLIVHLGSGDGLLTTALRTGGSFVVHGLDLSPDNVEHSRNRIHKVGNYGPVSVDHWCGDYLLFGDDGVGRGYYNKQSGLSVRCIKNQGSTLSISQSKLNLWKCSD